jgi:hypothetical protein
VLVLSDLTDLSARGSGYDRIRFDHEGLAGSAGRVVEVLHSWQPDSRGLVP